MNSALAWIERVLGSRVRHHEPITGATSSEVYRVELDEGPLVVLRLFSNEEWSAMEPDLAEHEAAALEAASVSALPTPELLAFDPIGAETGIPAVLMTELPGSVVVRPPEMGSWLDGLADALATVHAFDIEPFPWMYRVWQDLDQLSVPDWATRPLLWEEAIRLARKGIPSAPNRFIHRDFHPTNVLWSDGSVSGVVDWVNACWGPAGIDVAHCRLNLAAMYGTAVADMFSARYQAHSGQQVDPIWDLRAVTEWLPEGEVYPPWLELGLPDLDTPTVRNRLEEFAETALTRLS